MSATIKDVARRAGVSVATVSRVFNDSSPVREKTRRRVLDAAHALNYMPNGAARSLITSKTETLGVLLPDLYGEFFAEIIRGIDRTARARGYHVLMSGSHDDEDETRAVMNALHGRADGLLIMSSRIDVRLFESLLPEGLPVVLMNCKVEGPLPYDVLNVDNYDGAYAMVTHLTAHGHRRIAMIKGPDRNHDARKRLQGYRDALRDGTGVRDAALEIDGDFMQATGYRVVPEILRLRPRPTALFAANDSMAIGALGALHEAGIRVPEDLAVAGFDDVPSARFMSPPLSTVRVPVYEMGARATEYLLDAVHGDRAPAGRPEQFPTTLQLRASCGCGDHR